MATQQNLATLRLQMAPVAVMFQWTAPMGETRTVNRPMQTLADMVIMLLKRKYTSLLDQNDPLF
jgi:hypothetical protein